MEESIKQKKQMELQHLSLQFKTYKQTYQNRPLLTKQTDTYLELTKFIAQLAPTILAHYTYILNKEEISFVTTQIMIFVQDILSKLKSFSQKLEKKQSAQNVKKGAIEICRVCLHELRTVQVVAAKQQLQNKNQLSRNIMRLIKEIQEEGDTFTGEEDANFFHQLKIALQKKEEVLQICNTEGQQFAKLIQAQLKELLAVKELFVQQSNFKQSQQNKKGEDLKRQVNESLAKQFNSKIPHIIEIVSKSFKKSYERQRRMNSRSVQIQTFDNEGGKIFQLKRKLALTQTNLNNLVAQSDKLKWTIQEKQLLVNKLQKEMTHLRDELNKSSYQLQKTHRALQQKNKKYKESVEKLKSKKDFFDKQLDSNGRTVKTFTRLKQGEVPQEKKTQEFQSEEDFDVRSKKRKILLNVTKGSAKFLLPTLTKFNKEQNQLITKTEIYTENSDADIVSNSAQIQQLNKTTVQAYTGDLANNKQDNKISKMSKTGIQNQNKKQLKKILNLTQAEKLKQKKSHQQLQLKKSKSTEKGHYSQVKTDRSKEAEKISKVRASQNQRLTYKQKSNLPLIKNRSIKMLEGKGKQSSKKVDSDEEGREQQYEQEEQEKQMRDSIRQVSNRLRENILERASYSSVNSAGSTSQKQYKQRSILKNSTHQQSIFMQKKNSSKEESNNSKEEQAEVYEERPGRSIDYQQTEKIMLNSIKQSKNHNKKIILKNSFSKIKEEIDKQNYMTPILGVDSTGGEQKMSPSKQYENHQQKQKSKLKKNIIEHLQRFFDQINKISLQPQNVNYDKFKTVLTKCFKNQTPSSSKQESDLNQQHASTKQVNNSKNPIFYHDKSKKQQKNRSKNSNLNKEYIEGHSTKKTVSKQQPISQQGHFHLPQTINKSYNIQQKLNSSNLEPNDLKDIKEHKKQNILKIESYKCTPKNYQINMSQKQSHVQKKMKRQDLNNTISTSVEKAKQKLLSKEYHAEILQKQKMSKIIQGKQNNKKLPLKYVVRDHSSQAVKNPLNTSTVIKRKLLTQSQQGPYELIQFGLSLFINQQKAFKYETNFLKKNHKRPVTLSIEVQNYIKDLYEKLEQLKYLSNQNYQQVCKYLRYPFTTSQKECLHINIIHHININSLAQCFQKIIPIHSHCKLEHGLCPHLVSFKKKIVAFTDKYF